MKDINDIYFLFVIIIILLFVIIIWYYKWKAEENYAYLTIAHENTNAKLKYMQFVCKFGNRTLVSSSLENLIVRIPTNRIILWEHDVVLLNEIEYTLAVEKVQELQVCENNAWIKLAHDMLTELITEFKEKYYKPEK